MKYKEQRKLIYLKYNFSSMINLGVKGQRVDLLRDTYREKETEKKKRIIWGFFQFFQKNYKKSLSLSLYIYIYETYFIYLICHNIKNYDIITRIMGPFHIWGLKDNCLTCFYG